MDDRNGTITKRCATAFVEVFFEFLFPAVFAPFLYATYLVTTHEWFLATIVLAAWVPLILVMASWLRRNGIVRLWVSIGAVLLVVLAAIVALIGK